MAAGAGQVDFAKMTAPNVRDAIVSGQAFVDEGVVRCEQFLHRAVLEDDGLEQQLGFTAHGHTQTSIEILGGRVDRVELAQRQPGRGEIFYQCFCLWVSQHALYLRFQHGIID